MITACHSIQSSASQTGSQTDRCAVYISVFIWKEGGVIDAQTGTFVWVCDDLPGNTRPAMCVRVFLYGSFLSTHCG